MTEPAETVQTFLGSLQPGEVRTGTVVRCDGHDVVVDIAGVTHTHRAIGRIVRGELARRRVEDPTELVSEGQDIEVEVIGVDWRREVVLLSARACEDRVLRGFLVGLRSGDIVTGKVAAIHNFGVFVNLDGEPEGNCTGFIQIPELSWRHIDHASNVVEVGQRVTVEVLDSDTRRGQVSVSLKALQEDPFVRFAGRIGEVV